VVEYPYIIRAEYHLHIKKYYTYCCFGRLFLGPRASGPLGIFPLCGPEALSKVSFIGLLYW
jgi:hypothetical protein